MIANLPWYDIPELQSATDAFWQGLAQHLQREGLRDVPSQLARRGDCYAQWQNPNLLLSQACGADVVRRTAASLRVVATPSYYAPGCDGPNYRSWIVVRDESEAQDLHQLRGSICAINNPTSHSGHLAIRAMVQHLDRGPFFNDVIVAGSHVHSLGLLSAGTCDVAAIDCVTWALLADCRPAALSGLRIIGASAPAPAPPYVTGENTSDRDLERLRAGLQAAFDDPKLKSARDTLRLAGVSNTERCDYATLAEQQRVA